MIFFIEAVVLCIAFSLMVVPSARKNPVAWTADLPPKLRDRIYELGLVEQK